MKTALYQQYRFGRPIERLVSMDDINNISLPQYVGNGQYLPYPGVYVIAFDEFPEYCKIGFTSEGTRRLAELRNAVPFDPRLIHYIPCQSTLVASWLEKVIHDRVKEWRFRREWFKMPSAEMEKIKTIKNVSVSELTLLDSLRLIVDSALGTSDRPLGVRVKKLLSRDEMSVLYRLKSLSDNPDPKSSEWVEPTDENNISITVCIRLTESGFAEAVRVAHSKHEGFSTLIYRITSLGRDIYSAELDAEFDSLESEADHA